MSETSQRQLAALVQPNLDIAFHRGAYETTSITVTISNKGSAPVILDRVIADWRDDRGDPGECAVPGMRNRVLSGSGSVVEDFELDPTGGRVWDIECGDKFLEHTNSTRMQRFSRPESLSLFFSARDGFAIRRTGSKDARLGRSVLRLDTSSRQVFPVLVASPNRRQ